MDFARAVKGPILPRGIIHEIQEEAKIELQRLLTEEELVLLNNNYSLENLLWNMRKVILISNTK